MANRYCSHCGYALPDDSRFCPNCGKPTQTTAHVPTPEADVPVPPPPGQRAWGTATPPPGQAYALTQERSPAFRLFVGSAIVIVVLLLLGAVLAAVSVAGGGSQLFMPSFGAPQSADEVLQGLKDKDLPIGESVAYTAENDPNDLLGRPNQYTSKVTFKDTRIDPHSIADKIDVRNGGSIEVFENQDDATARKNYVESIGKAFAPAAEYTYREGTVLLRLSHQLTPKQAEEYENALRYVL
jgi:zinc-ribbon domain